MTDLKRRHLHTRRDELEVFWIPADLDIPCELKVITNTITALQKMVGGHIEMVPYSMVTLPALDCGCTARLVANEDGFIKRLPYNDRASQICLQELVGDILVIAEGPISKTEDDLWGLPEKINLWQGPGNPWPN
jgi:hypothetical protein